MAEEKKFKWFIKIFWTGFIGSIVFFILYMTLTSFGVFGEMPNYKELENPKIDFASEIYCNEGEPLGKFYKANRIYVSYEDLNKDLIKALIATEDVRFYKHSGIDGKGTARAILLLGQRGGASTISQQLAKMLFTNVSRNLITRIKQKMQEWVIAAQLERRYTKEEIITMYFNQYDFLHNAVGIHSASKVYFNKTPDELNIQESAMFVAMAKSAWLYNPKSHPERALKRRNTVLNQMQKYGYISQSECDSIKDLPLELDFKKESYNTGIATYFRQVLRSDIIDILDEKNKDGSYKYVNEEGEKYNLFTDGLKIYTTIDDKMQRYAEWAVQEYMGKSLQNHFYRDLKNRKQWPFANKVDKSVVDKILWSAIQQSTRYKMMTEGGKKRIPKSKVMEAFNKPTKMEVYTWNGVKDTTMTPLDSIKHYKAFLHAGLLSVDPNTGFVKAWVGGINSQYFKLDHVKQSQRQAGSIFKPILYATALEEDKIHPCEEIANMPYTLTKKELRASEDWTPAYGPKFEGMASYKYGLANSMNNFAVKVMQQIEDPQNVVDMAKRLGITAELEPVASIALGVSDVSLYEMVGALSTFAAMGYYHKPTYLLRIEDKRGKIIYSAKPEGGEKVDPHTCYTLLKMMEAAVDGEYNKTDGRKRGTGMSLRSNYRIKAPIAGKTGTTQNSTDGWFVGMTPDLVTGVWVGADDRAVRFQSAYFGQGAVMALPIWGMYMKKLYVNSSIDISEEDFEMPEDYELETDCKKFKEAKDEDEDFNDEEEDFNQ